MTMTDHPALAHLRAGQFLKIHDGRGQTLAVFDGLVWVTQDSDPRDAFVAGGGTFSFDRPGLAIVEALSDARVAMLMDATESETADQSAFA
jgi:hypothetical protein